MEQAIGENTSVMKEARQDREQGATALTISGGIKLVSGNAETSAKRV